jgi:hypothetical protein
MRPIFATLLVWMVLLGRTATAEATCAVFAPQGQEIHLTGEKVFLTWMPDKTFQSLTIQPTLAGNAPHFGLVLVTPSQPRLIEVRNDFFEHLKAFTLLEPMDTQKYKGRHEPQPDYFPKEQKEVEPTLLGRDLSYKPIPPERAKEVFAWLKENQYDAEPGRAALDSYIKKKWFFTVIKVTTKQLKRDKDGFFKADFAPLRFQFHSEKVVLPLTIMQCGVKDGIEVRLYAAAPFKLDLPDEFSCQVTWLPKWSSAISSAAAEKLTTADKTWHKHIAEDLARCRKQSQRLQEAGRQPATLEWSKRLTEKDINVLRGKEPFNREAPPQVVRGLGQLGGFVQRGDFITKFKKRFTIGELKEDLELVRARVREKEDDLEYSSLLPTMSP